MKRIELMFVLVASLVFGACSTDDNNNNNNDGYTVVEISEAPVWQVNWNNDQERPNWTEPSAIYENWTIMMVQLEETLQPFASGDDLMAIFINDELRGLASPASVVGSEEFSSKFILKAWGNETGSETVKMSLSYYCQKLKHMFTLSANIKLDSDETTGIDEAFIPTFTLGSAKYPAVMSLDAKDLLSKAGIKPAAGDLVSAFVGDECRGVNASPATKQTLVVYGREEGEPVTLKYYQAATGKLFVFADAAQTKK